MSLWLVEDVRARAKNPLRNSMRFRRVEDFNGKEKTFQEWVDIYCRRAGDETIFILNPRENIYFHPEHGFFTYIPDYDNKLLEIPKMCGDGRFLREVLVDFARALKPLGCRGVRFCTRRKHYDRIVGGTLEKVEEAPNPITGKKTPLYYFVVTWDDTKSCYKYEKEEEQTTKDD